VSVPDPSGQPDAASTGGPAATPRVAGLLLAAGEGRRYGMPKALVESGGRLLVERALATLRAGGCDPVVVVLGAAAGEVRARADLGGALVVDNPDWATGMGSSLRTGLAAAAGLPVDAVAVLLVDTPGISPAAVRRMAGHGTRAALAMATYHGEPGHPVVIGRDHWPGVAELAVGDAGARRYLAKHAETVTDVPCQDIADGTDIDTPR
jgi:CTP:molybdopterin cytidylyltransferase MocA